MFGWLMPGGRPGPGSPGRVGSVARGPADRGGVAQSGSEWLVLPGSSQSHRQRPSGEREREFGEEQRDSQSVSPPV